MARRLRRSFRDRASKGRQAAASITEPARVRRLTDVMGSCDRTTLTASQAPSARNQGEAKPRKALA